MTLDSFRHLLARYDQMLAQLRELRDSLARIIQDMEAQQSLPGDHPGRQDHVLAALKEEGK